ncbi:hypothetical protein F5Y19DRAFT_479352 [Xylariaceae sp. FL1651]|nr:hypothetical protein F5Y19DRAFT_479352 [Xylariaceae sp. FL1651]
MDPAQVATIRAHPLGTHLDAVCTSFEEIVKDLAELETISREAIQDLGLFTLNRLNGQSSVWLDP